MSGSLTDDVPGTRQARELDARRGRRAKALRSGFAVGAMGLLTVVPLYLVINHLQSLGKSAAAIGMASMHMSRMGVYWAFPILQASGIAALVWAYIGVMLGLLQSGRRTRWSPPSRARADQVHRQISLLVLGLILVHALATAYDAMGDGFLSAFVPWQESWTASVFAYNLGIFALYLAVLVGPTYYFRRKIGPVRWRFLHRLALIVYVLSVWHTLLLGLDFSYYPWVRPLTWLAQIPLLVLFVRRLMRPARSGKTLSTACGDWLTATRYALVALSVAAIVGIALLVVTGHSDLPARVGYHTPMARVVGNPWLPLWLRIVATAAFGAVLVVHLWHIARCAGRERAWHSGHVLMALGMIVMFLPTSGMIVSARGGQVVFAVAALGVGGSLLADAMRYRRVGALWVVGCVDLAAMAYMFVMPSAPAEWLTGLAVAWFALQAFGWATGRLGTMADLGGPRSAEVVGAAGTEVSVCSAHRQVSDRSVRATLTVMSLGMGYMFLAMQFGMHQMSIMPGMPGM